MKIKIKYFSEDYPRLKKIEKGDRIDLRVDRLESIDGVSEGELEVARLNLLEDGKLEYQKGDVITLGLGVAMELPKGYEAVVSPRSSTFKNWGLIQTNSFGVIDESYCGDDDEWLIQFIAMRDGSIDRLDRVAQFRIQEKMKNVELEEVQKLGNPNRGGYGSTGRK